MKKIALVVAPLLLFLVVPATAALVAPDDHGGAFMGPCIYTPHSPNGPADKLTLTDYGPPVSVGWISVADFDVTGAQVGSSRLTVGTDSDLIVGHRQSHTFFVQASAGTKTCKFVDWGESTRYAGTLTHV